MAAVQPYRLCTAGLQEPHLYKLSCGWSSSLVQDGSPASSGRGVDLEAQNAFIPGFARLQFFTQHLFEFVLSHILLFYYEFFYAAYCLTFPYRNELRESFLDLLSKVSMACQK